MRIELIAFLHNLTPAEERLLCHGWHFCVKHKMIKIEEFETNIEINAVRLESDCHLSTFSTAYIIIYMIILKDS